jgi:hypothetical protein
MNTKFVATRNERIGLAWFKTDIWKLRRMRTGCEKSPLCREEDVICIYTHTIKMFEDEEVEGTIFM